MIDFVASGLIFILNTIKNTYKLDNVKTNEQDDQLETEPIQELYRKVNVIDDTKYHRGQRHVNKIDVDDSDDMPSKSVIIFCI